MNSLLTTTRFRHGSRWFYAVLAWLSLASAGWSQGVPAQSFPQTAPVAPQTFPPAYGAPTAPATFGTPTPSYDPYTSSSTINSPGNLGTMLGTGNMYGTGYQSPPVYGQPPVTYGQPAPNPYSGIPAPPVTATWPGSAPATNTYGANPYANPYGTSPYGAPVTPTNPFAPGSPYYNQPAQPALFPNGMTWGAPQGYVTGTPTKVFQDVGIRYTWVRGGDAENDLDINDIEFHGSMVFPNFLNSNQPLYITPGFIWHLWNGPDFPLPPPGMNRADLPSQAYSGYLATGWRSAPEQVIGADLNFQVGIYSDFQTLVWDSVRFQGQGLLLVRLTPTMTLKGGVRYLDRADIKMLPAAGILWQPTPMVKFDIFFPQPKLAVFLSTIGSSQVWAYAAGEYGGGNWTISEPYGVDRVDINDIRASGGIEWFGASGVNGFVEAGYVFHRRVVYVVDPTLSFSSPSTFMVRGGLSF